MPPTTRRGAVAKRLEDATQPDILDLVLTHAGPSGSLKQGMVCILLCVSRGTAARVGQVCSGSLALRAAPRSLQSSRQLSDWLITNGGLLQRLEFAPDMPLATPKSRQDGHGPFTLPLSFEVGPGFAWEPGIPGTKESKKCRCVPACSTASACCVAHNPLPPPTPHAAACPLCAVLCVPAAPVLVASQQTMQLLASCWRVGCCLHRCTMLPACQA
jgi:hypothetical protein